MFDYEIAIPSYRRADSIASKSLATLDRLGVDRSRITIFVADETEREQYAAAIGDSYKIVTGVLGKSRQQAFYHGLYAAETRLLCLDDDITGVSEMIAENKLAPTTRSLDEIVRLGFVTADNFGARMWGISHSGNAFYMRRRVEIGFRFVGGGLFGCYAGDPVFTDRESWESAEEDQRSTIDSFSRYGATVRLNFLTTKSDYFAEGGIVAEYESAGRDRQDETDAAVLSLCARYPDLVYQTERKGIMKLAYRRVVKTRHIPVEIIEELVDAWESRS
jgi:hypothetical protein